MPSLACPKCKTKLDAPVEVLGQSVRCTRCGSTFEASTSLSPYTEGLPPLPKDQRRWLMLTGVGVCLVVGFGVLLGINYLMNPGEDEPQVLRPELPPTLMAPPVRKAITLSDGTPIDLPDPTAPDRPPPPGVDETDSLKKFLPNRTESAKRERPSTTDEVTLVSAKWSLFDGRRMLAIVYLFHAGNNPGNGNYVLKIKVDRDPAMESPLASLMPAEGVMTVPLPGIISDKLPKVEVWIEKSLAGGVVRSVSNVVKSE